MGKRALTAQDNTSLHDSKSLPGISGNSFSAASVISRSSNVFTTSSTDQRKSSESDRGVQWEGGLGTSGEPTARMLTLDRLEAAVDSLELG